MTVEGRPAKATTLRLTTNDERVPTDHRNTAWKMVERALDAMRAADVHIHIEKSLPVQGGMGAGSANAVAALIGLERELACAVAELPGPSACGSRRWWDPMCRCSCWEERCWGWGAAKRSTPCRAASDGLRGGAAGDRGFDAAGLSGLGCAAGGHRASRTGRPGRTGIDRGRGSDRLTTLSRVSPRPLCRGFPV